MPPPLLHNNEKISTIHFFFLFYQNVRQAQDLGLQPRHAYTISKVLQIRGTVGRARDQGIPLVRIRNPHGDHKEWRGAWSDG